MFSCLQGVVCRSGSHFLLFTGSAAGSVGAVFAESGFTTAQFRGIPDYILYYTGVCGERGVFIFTVGPRVLGQPSIGEVLLDDTAVKFAVNRERADWNGWTPPRLPTLSIMPFVSPIEINRSSPPKHLIAIRFWTALILPKSLFGAETCDEYADLMQSNGTFAGVQGEIWRGGGALDDAGYI